MSDVQRNKQPSPANRAGNLIQNLGLNMLMIGLLALAAFLAWQRFGLRTSWPPCCSAWAICRSSLRLA